MVSIVSTIQCTVSIIFQLAVEGDSSPGQKLGFRRFPYELKKKLLKTMRIMKIKC